MPAGQKSLQLRFKHKAFGASLRYLVQDSGNNLYFSGRVKPTVSEYVGKHFKGILQRID